MEKLQLRKATSEDLMLLYKWVNDPATRDASFNSENISLEEHKRWFENALSDKNIFIFILMLEDIPIGQVRLDIKNNLQFIDYSIDSEYRRRGYGKKILQLLESEFTANLPLVGLVKFENVPSQKIFEDLGYKKYLKKDYLEYIKVLY